MKERLIAFENHLNELKQNVDFVDAFEIEKKLLKFGLIISSTRQEKKISMRKLSQISGTPLNQIVKLERGENCRINTYLKVCNTLGIKIEFN